MESLTIGSEVKIETEEGKEGIARIKSKNGDMVELTTENNETLFMRLQKTKTGWELVPGTRVVSMITL